MSQNEKRQWETPTVVSKPVSETLTQGGGGNIGIGS